jgi:hypothetical protein
MGASMYVEGDNVDIYVDGSFCSHGKVVEVSSSGVRVQFRDRKGKTKTFDTSIGSSLSKQSESGHWEINVSASAIHDLP